MPNDSEARLRREAPRTSGQGPTALTSNTTPRVEWSHWVPLGVIVVLALAAYSNSFTGGFVFDDIRHVRDNADIRDLGAFASWSGFLRERHRFFGYLTFAVNYTLGGLSVVDYHLVNFAIHVATAGLVYALVVLSFRTPRLRDSALVPSAQAVAFVAAVLFATHPIQTQAVSYIVQRLTSLAALLYLLAVVLYLVWRIRHDAHDQSRVGLAAVYVGVLLTTSVAMLTKEIAFTLPVAIVLCELTFFDGPAWRRRVFLLPIASTILIVPLTWLSTVRLTSHAISNATRVQTGISRLEYAATEIPVVVSYLRLLVWPAGQSLDHDIPVAKHFTDPRVIASAFVLSALLAVACWLYRRTAEHAHRDIDLAARLIGFGIAWFFLGLVVESTFIPIVDMMNEHRVYLPSIGVFTAGAAASALLVRRVRPASVARPLVATAVIVASVLGVATFVRNRTWADEVALWSDAARKAPAKARPHENLGTALALSGHVAEAAREFRRAVDIDPTASYSRAQLGAAYLALGRLGEAERELREAVHLAPNDPEALYNLAVVLSATGRTAEAKPLLQRFRQVAPLAVRSMATRRSAAPSP